MYHTLPHTHTYQAISGLYRPEETTEILITTQIFHLGFNFQLSPLFLATAPLVFSLNLAIFMKKKKKIYL